MKAIYNDNLTIETRDDADQRNLHECWALQKVIEGKALVIGGGITPIKQNEPMHDGVSLWLAEDPTENAEIKIWYRKGILRLTMLPSTTAQNRAISQRI